jgi:large subunit ribosomal protein L15
MSMIHNVSAAVPRYKRPTRKGRGRSAGKGKTAGRGTKGTKARVGKYIRRGYEGGQTEIYRRFPKRGFSNVQFARRFHVVNLADLAKFPADSVVDAAALKDKGLIPDLKRPVKILGDGEFNVKLTVQAGWYSKSAHAKLLAAGGTAQTAKGETFEFPKPKKKFIPRETSRESGKKGGKKADAEATADAKPDNAQKPEKVEGSESSES